MKHLIIIGARGFGREVYNTVLLSHQYLDGEWDVKGFLDDMNGAFDGLRGEYPPILGPVETYKPQPDDVFICALGNAHYRRKYAEIILNRGGEFVSLISSEARVNKTARIGVGCVICRYALISDNVDVGDFTMIHAFSNFGHDARVGAYNSIESYVFFGGGASTGEMTTMHVRSAIIPHKKVGNNVSVGFGSVVMRNFGDNLHLFGNPAKKMEF